MRLNQSFSMRLSLYVILATSVLCIGGLVGAEIFSVKALKDSVSKEARDVLEVQIKDVEKILAEVERTSESLSWVVKENREDADFISHLCEKAAESNPYISEFTVVFEQYASGIQDGNSRVWMDRGSLTTCSVPLSDENGHTFAVLQSDVPLQNITDKLSSLEGYEHSYSMLLGRSGSFISHPDSAVFNATTIFEYADGLRNEGINELGNSMIAGGSGSMTIKDRNGEKAYVTYGPLYNGWSMAIFCPYSDIYKDAHKVNSTLFILMLLELLLLYAVIRRIVNRTTKPIIEFAYSALSIGKGNFKARLPKIGTHDELRRLHDSLEYMLMSFNDYIEQLKLSTKSNERYESELNIASNIQKQMLPGAFPESDRFDIYARLSPAKEVGGDLFDFLVRDNCLYIAIGDVSGKGVPAALYMAITRYAFNFIAGLNLSVEDVVGKINNSFCNGNSSMMFVTMFVAKINLDTYEMEFCNAGHNPIALKDPDGSARFLNAKPNLAIGLMSDFPFEKETVQLSGGTRLLLYTDGVTEAEEAGKSQYGEDRLMEFVRNIAENDSSKTVIDNLFSSVKGFTGENEQNDDITVLTVKL